MPIAAVPRYLPADDFSEASPGHRFSLYLRLWGIDQRTEEALWTTHDRNYRRSGQSQREREFRDENKTRALQETLKLASHDRPALRALLERQSALAAALAATGQLATFDASSVAPFVTGLGNEHPLENGFSFLNPYGLPCLPGSGIKGVLRRTAQELMPGGPFADEASGWNREALHALFGVEDGEGDPQRGALIFWDVIPELEGNSLKVEVMTPHQSDYYQKEKSPHDSGSPNPIFFLSVPPKSRFIFHVQCHRSLLARRAPVLLEEGGWQKLLQKAFEHAFAWLGFGAKTAVGYGAMAFDQAATDRRLQAMKDLEEEQRKLDEAAVRETALAQMTPLERKITEAIDGRDVSQGEDSALFNAIEAGDFNDEERPAAAQHLKELMQTKKSWKESSTKKRPDKDKPYQRTLQVIEWLKDVQTPD